MTVKELKEYLNIFTDDTEVKIFNPKTGSMDEIYSMSINGPGAQINIEPKFRYAVAWDWSGNIYKCCDTVEECRKIIREAGLSSCMMIIDGDRNEIE